MRQVLNESIDDYVTHLKSRGLAPGYLKSCRVTLRRLMTVVGNILTESIHEGHIDQYFNDASRTRSNRSLGVDTAHLRGFFDWAVRTRRAGRNGNPMAGRKKPKYAPREWRGLPASKFPALLDATRHPRDRILMALGIYLLGRAAEFQILRVADVMLEAGSVSYRIPKTHKVDLLPICEELDVELRRWLTFYTEECGPLDPNWYLVPAKTKAPLRGPGIQDFTQERLVPARQMKDLHKTAVRILEAIGYQVRDENGKALNEGMHTLRRSAARALYEQLRDEGDPSPVETVRSMLNHSTELQTRHYIGLQSDRIHRDARLRGRVMFPGLRGENVRALSPHGLGPVRQAN